MKTLFRTATCFLHRGSRRRRQRRDGAAGLPWAWRWQTSPSMPRAPCRWLVSSPSRSSRPTWSPGCLLLGQHQQAPDHDRQRQHAGRLRHRSLGQWQRHGQHQDQRLIARAAMDFPVNEIYAAVGDACFYTPAGGLEQATPSSSQSTCALVTHCRASRSRRAMRSVVPPPRSVGRSSVVLASV